MTSASLSDAAKKLGRTQPAVSAAIKTLEEQLGLKLFSRNGRKLVPLPEAQYLLTETTTILGQLTRVQQTMKSLADGQTGALNVAAMPGPISMLFPRFIAQRIEPDSGTTVSMQARSSKQIAELARAQSIDFAFADAPEDDANENLYKTEVITADCFVALPVDHVLSPKKHVDLADLDAVSMGTLQATHVHTRELARRFTKAALDFNVMVESQTFLPILQFVAAGQCCSVVDPLTAMHVRMMSDLSDVVDIRPLRETLRYSYAIYQPQYRPMSLLAQHIRNAWRAHVIQILDETGAAPRVGRDGHSMSDKISL